MRLFVNPYHPFNHRLDDLDRRWQRLKAVVANGAVDQALAAVGK